MMKVIQKKPINAPSAEIKLNHILNMYTVMTRQEVADKLNITQEAVWYFEKNAFRKIRQKLASLKVYNLDGIV